MKVESEEGDEKWWEAVILSLRVSVPYCHCPPFTYPTEWPPPHSSHSSSYRRHHEPSEVRWMKDGREEMHRVNLPFGSFLWRSPHVGYPLHLPGLVERHRGPKDPPGRHSVPTVVSSLLTLRDRSLPERSSPLPAGNEWNEWEEETGRDRE